MSIQFQMVIKQSFLDKKSVLFNEQKSFYITVENSQCKIGQTTIKIINKIIDFLKCKSNT